MFDFAMAHPILSFFICIVAIGGVTSIIGGRRSY